MYASLVRITDGLIQTQGKLILAHVNRRLSQPTQIDLKFSSCWLQKFKKRSDFEQCKSHGEDGGADEVAIQSRLPSL